MNQEVITRASEIINAKTGYIGNGMEGYAVVALHDENGDIALTTKTIASADGIRWLAFNTHSSRNALKRIAKNNRGSVCISSSEYHISLVGTFEILTDSETKKANFFEPMCGYLTGADDPHHKVIRFTTERYNLYIVDTGEAEGALKTPAENPAPKIEPMLQFNGQCADAIELYKKAFGAELAYLGTYASANPKDLPPKYNPANDANLVYHAQLMIGSQRVMLCDNLFNDQPAGHTVYPVIQFKTAARVMAAYEILKDGAAIVGPPAATTYSECCCSLVDKFGIFWDLMVY